MIRVAIMAVVLLGCVGVQAEVVIDTVPVGNAGNASDSFNWGTVDYEYDIGKYEITARQYTEFLNAVAATDTYGLYNVFMWEDTYGRSCKIERTGSPGSYTYMVAGDWADRPVNYVSWADAARFANWLHNGQPTGLQDLSTTEDGAYFLNGATTEAQLIAVSREWDWKWGLPSHDEWYKAAYHKNDGATGNYFDYPTGSDTMPSNQLVDPDPGNNATFRVETDYTIGSPYYRTEVGAHENSASPYGTFDQGGNVYEWNDTLFEGPHRGLRGGSYVFTESDMVADYYDYHHPTFEFSGIGFRVVKARLPGDCDNDGDVDSADFAELEACLFGPSGGLAGGCSCFDMDNSGSVDLADFAIFQSAFTG